MRRLRYLIACAAVLAGSTIGPRAQDGGQDAPTFRSSIEAIEIDVYVTDEAGDPVSGLTRDDFRLVENGQEQPITTFEAVNIPITRSEAVERDVAEPDVRANNGPEGRLYVFALGDIGQINILRTKQFVHQFLDTHFGPHDVGAIVILGRALATDGQDFTSSRQLLRDAIDRFSGNYGLADMYPRGRSIQLESLRSLTELMARMEGRHKALVFFTETLDVDVLDLVDYQGGVLSFAMEDAHAAMAAATRSNLAIYPIDPTGLSPDAVPLARVDAFNAMANATGGVALINSNSFEETFARIVRDNSTYYMLGFNSAYTRDDGRYVRLEVRTTRPGLTVRTRDGYVAPTRDQRRARERAREDETPPASTASSALASPLTTNGLPLRVFAAPFKGEKDDARVALVLELEAAALGLTFEEGAYTGAVDVSYVVTDARRKIYPEVRHTTTVNAEPNTGTAAPLDGVRVRVLTELELPEGRYQVRLGAGTEVRSGSVVYDIEVPDFDDGELSLSGVALVSPSERNVLTLQSDTRTGRTKTVTCYSERCGAPAGPPPSAVRAGRGRGRGLVMPAQEPYLGGLLPGPPTTTREFTAQDELLVVAEVYDRRRVRRNETPHAITFTAALRGPDGRTIPLASDERPATAERTDAGRHAFTLPLPLEGVPPGLYAVRVEAQSSARDEPPIAREIPIRVK